MAVGIAGTVLLAIGAFSLSFTSLTHLAVRAGIDESQAWEWPLIVDGVIVVATVSVVALKGRKGTGYAWGLLIGGAAVSVACNAWQAMRMNTQESPWMAGFVATIPPVVLLAATHMTVILTRPDDPPETSTDGWAASDDRTRSTARMEGAHPIPGATPETTAAGIAAPVSPVFAESESLATGSRRARSGEGSRTWKVNKANSLREQGLTVGQIATQLGVSIGSVRRYLKPEPEADIGQEDHQ